MRVIGSTVYRIIIASQNQTTRIFEAVCIMVRISIISFFTFSPNSRPRYLQLMWNSRDIFCRSVLLKTFKILWERRGWHDLHRKQSAFPPSLSFTLSLFARAYMCEYMWQQKEIIIRNLYTKIRLRWNVGVNIAKKSVNTRLVLLLTRGRDVYYCNMLAILSY